MKLLTLIIFMVITFGLHASEERWINFDWEPVEGANSYEIELLQNVSGDILSKGIFKTDLPEWHKSVSPGKYFVKLRALDKRNVAGEWSERVAISIQSAPPVLEYPAFEEFIEISKNNEHIQKFSWKPSNESKFYKFQIYNADGILLHSETLPSTNSAYPLSKPGKYSWNVAAIDDENDKVEMELKKNPFTVSYGKLKATALTVNNAKMNVLISWNKIPNAEKYLVNFSEQLEDSSYKMLVSRELTDNKINIPKTKISTGTYRFTVKAIGSGYIDSEESEVLYDYEKGEIKILLENSGNQDSENARDKSAARLEFFGAIPSMDYEFKNFEQDTQSLQSLSGTALEIGWYGTPLLKNTLYESAFYSNLKLMSLSDTYASSIFGKLSFGINKNFNFSKLQLTPYFGIFVEKSSAFVISRMATSNVTEKSLLTAGPQLGLTESYKLNSSFTLFSSQSISLHFLQFSGLEDNEFEPSAAFDIDLGAKYFLKNNFDLIAKLSYKSLMLESSAKIGGSSFAQKGDVNSVSINGTTFAAGVVWYY